MASLARAIAVLGAVSAIGTATQVAKGKLGALLLGAAGVGVLNQLTTLYNLLFIVAGLGFFNGMMRQISLAVKDGDGTQARAQMNSVSLFLAFASLLITLGCVLLAPQISDLLFGDGGERYALVAFVTIAVPIAVQQRIFRAYLNSMRDLKAISRAQVGADVSSVVIFAIAAWQFGIWGAVLAFVSMHLLLLVGMVWFATRSGGIGLAFPHPRHFRWAEIVPNFGYGINNLIIAAVASGSAIVIGRMIISAYGLAEAGIFSVAFKVATVYFGALYAAAGSYYFPTLVRIEGVLETEREANQAVALYTTILPPLMAGLIVFGDIMIPLLFSDEFAPAVPVMAALLLGDIFRVTSETLGLTLLARRHLVSYTSIYLVYAISFVGLAWWLLPVYGLAGVGIAYAVTQVVNLALVLAACRFTIGMNFTWSGIRPFLLAIAAVAPITIAEFAGLSMVAKIALGVLLGGGWLALSWSQPEMVKLRHQIIKRLKLQ